MSYRNLYVSSCSGLASSLSFIIFIEGSNDNFDFFFQMTILRGKFIIYSPLWTAVLWVCMYHCSIRSLTLYGLYSGEVSLGQIEFLLLLFEERPCWFCNGCTGLHLHQLHGKVPFFPSHPSQHLMLFCVIDYSHSDWDKMKFQSSFDLHFPKC